jgi:hypothetical protein
MPRLAALVTILVVATALPARALTLTPAHYWSKGFGSTSTDQCFSVAQDQNGYVYLAAAFSGTVDFGGGGLTSAGGTDIVIARFNTAGSHLWSMRYGGTGNDAPRSISVDLFGTAFVTGNFSGTVDFGGGNLVSAGSSDVFVASYSNAGTPVWSRRYGSTAADQGQAVSVPPTANLLAVTGYFSGTADFGGGNLAHAGGNDIFVACYDKYTGNHVWSKSFGSVGTDAGRSVVVDGLHVFVSGEFTNTVNLGGTNLVSAGNADAFLAAYTSAGGHYWSNRFGDAGFQVAYGVAPDALGGVYMTGYSTGNVDFGGGVVSNHGSGDVMLARFNSAGMHLWGKLLGDAFSDVGLGVCGDGDGGVFVTGYYTLYADFGGGAVNYYGDSDIFLARFDAAGNHRWSQGYGGTGSDQGLGVAVDAYGNPCVSGHYFGAPVTLGGSTVPNAGVFDIFLARYFEDPTEPEVLSVSDLPNDQGHQARIRFARSGYDDPLSSVAITEYEAYRRVDNGPAAQVVLGAPSHEALLAAGWEQVGTVSAHAEEEYTMTVPTVGDSTEALGQYYSAFYIRATTPAPASFYDSPADSGYSLDNLAPGIPLNLVYDTGDLAWDESSAADFDFFTVYGANVDAFGVATLVDYSVSPGMDVSGSPYVFYWVTATDFSGNEGKPARVNTLSDVGAAPASYVLSVTNFPNPFNPRTTVNYTVPSRGRVTVDVYDVRGAHVATLFDGERAAGAYHVEWNGRGANGSVVGSGVYFARIEHSGAARTKKLVLLK